MSWLSNIFGGSQKNPADAAMPYLNKIPGQVQPYYQPYQEAGRAELGDLTARYREMLDNPSAVYNQAASGYTQSPGYAATLREALAGANNAAALGGGGGLGTPGHQQYAATAAGDVANKDFQDYLSKVLGLHTQGLEGEQGLEAQGYGANTDYGQMLAQLLGTQGQYAFEGQKGNNAAQSQNWSNLFSGIGAISPFIANKFFPTSSAKGV